jgi:TetR/AcrR family transcriptional regulator, transcriptional repressor for nem operon
MGANADRGLGLPFWPARSKIKLLDHEDRRLESCSRSEGVMARPREFDEATVLEAAMQCFWARGFGQTSVRELAEEMGITGASLYNAFGDKRSLYRQAFAHYLGQTVRDRVARLEKLPPLAAIRTFFAEIIDRSVDDDQRRGCMLVNAALELAPYDAEFQQLVGEEFSFIEAFFRHCVAAGQKDGTIAGGRSAKALARLLLSVLIGVRVLARTRPQRDVLEGAASSVLALLRTGAQRPPRPPSTQGRSRPSQDRSRRARQSQL